MPVHLRFRKNKSGKTSLYLDTHSQGHRSRERLANMFLYQHPRSQDEKKHNQETRFLAEKKLSEAQSDLMYESQDMVSPVKQEAFFIDYFEEFKENYNKKDKSKVRGSVKHFIEFQADKKYRFKDFNENIVSDFKKYLEGKVSGETARAYFGNFRYVLKRAHIDRLCRYDIRTFEARFKIDKGLKKEYLTEEELLKLWHTPIENEQERDAFVFSCFTGLRPVDVRSLKGKDIKNGKFQKEQSKTEKKIEVPVSETGMMIYKKYYRGDSEPLFDNLPSYNGWNKALKGWMARAKINKHITTYCSRHTFCMMLLQKGTDWRTIIDFMGWNETNGMKMLFVYTRTMEKSMSSAAESLLKLK